jgi:hypothetical protein
MELPSRDTTTAPPSIATSLDSVRHLRHAFGIAPLGRDNPVNCSQPHPVKQPIYYCILSESRRRRTYDFGCSAADGSLATQIANERPRLLMSALQRALRLQAMPLEFEIRNALEAPQVRSRVQPLLCRLPDYADQCPRTSFRGGNCRYNVGIIRSSWYISDR